MGGECSVYQLRRRSQLFGWIDGGIEAAAEPEVRQHPLRVDDQRFDGL